MDLRRLTAICVSGLAATACATTTGITDPQECIQKYGIAAKVCLDEVAARNKEIEGEIQEIEVDTSETQSQLVVLKARQTALQNEYASLRSQLDTEAQDLAEMRSTLTKLRTNSRLTEVQYQTLLNELESVNSRILVFQAKPVPNMPTQGDVKEIDEFLGTEVAMIKTTISNLSF